LHQTGLRVCAKHPEIAGSLFIDPIAFNEPDLHFEIHTVSGTYDGKVDPQGTFIKGNWKQSGASAPLVLKRVKKSDTATTRHQEDIRLRSILEGVIRYESHLSHSAIKHR
jgi:hypothetical protein